MAESPRSLRDVCGGTMLCLGTVEGAKALRFAEEQRQMPEGL